MAIVSKICANRQKTDIQTDIEFVEVAIFHNFTCKVYIQNLGRFGAMYRLSFICIDRYVQWKYDERNIN